MRRTRLLALIAVMLLVFGCGMLFPILTQRAVDAIVSHKNMGEFAGYLLVAALFMGAESLLTHVRQLQLVNLGTFIDNRLSNLCFLHMMRLRADRRIATSGSVSVYFQHLTKIRSFLLATLPQTIFELGAGLLALVVMAVYSLPVTIGATVIVAASAWHMKRLLPQIYAGSADQFAKDGERLAFFNESYNGLETVKTLAVEGRRYRRWQILTRAFLDAMAKVFIVGQKIGLSALVSTRILSLAIIGIGCYQIGRGQITIGDLIALQLLSFRLQAPVVAAGNVVRQYQEANIALAGVRQFLLTDTERARGRRASTAPAPVGSLEFRNVSLTYSGNAAPSVNDISFQTPEKGLVALIGRNGAGKTTLLNILLGLQREYEGTVTLAGQELRDHHPRHLRSRIGVAAQDATLFAGTVRSNLDVGLKPVTERETADALSLAGATQDAVYALDREIKEAGRNLSGGQRQRLAVARSLIGTPPILVLDEPTAFLDAEAARRLDRTLVALAAERLLIMVSHNLSATRSAAMIVVLEKGKVAGVGRHGELLATCDAYRELWQSHMESLGIEGEGVFARS